MDEIPRLPLVELPKPIAGVVVMPMPEVRKLQLFLALLGDYLRTQIDRCGTVAETKP